MGPGGSPPGPDRWTFSKAATNDDLLSETLSPSGLSGSGNQSYGYDRADRLVSWTKPDGSTTTYGWDAAGNRTSVGGTASTFDERNRQLSDGSGSYTYTYTARRGDAGDPHAGEHPPPRRRLTQDGSMLIPGE
ncbi:RHS repeat domain-containing protein [Frankia sp. Cppng1_Ct_nod]|uniref:RHS repeat domain-containing protein n=1 Tax=Frankia sp. Cppng1_Ct_nod TaxID=2897162 RepID=UPI001041814B